MLSSLLVSVVAVAVAVTVAVVVAEAISLQGRSRLAKETEDIKFQFLKMDDDNKTSKSNEVKP
jgi:hypothetical protein